MEPINPVEHAQRMYEIFRTKDGMTHDQALFRALCVACEEQRGRCAETCEKAADGFIAQFKQRPDVWGFQDMAAGAKKAAEAIREMPPVNVDKDGILR